MIPTPYDWLNKLYRFRAAVVGIVIRHGFSVDACCGNQLKLALYEPLLSLYQLIKTVVYK